MENARFEPLVRENMLAEYSRHIDLDYHSRIEGLKQPVTAFDVIQNVLLKLVEKIRTGKIEFANIANIAGYVNSAVRNRSIDIKQQKINRSKLENEVWSIIETTEQNHVALLVDDIKKELVTRKNQKNIASIFELKYISGLTIKEIAEELNIAKVTVEKTLQKIRSRVTELVLRDIVDTRFVFPKNQKHQHNSVLTDIEPVAIADIRDNEKSLSVYRNHWKQINSGRYTLQPIETEIYQSTAIKGAVGNNLDNINRWTFNSVNQSYSQSIPIENKTGYINKPTTAEPVETGETKHQKLLRIASRKMMQAQTDYRYTPVARRIIAKLSCYPFKFGYNGCPYMGKCKTRNRIEPCHGFAC